MSRIKALEPPPTAETETSVPGYSSSTVGSGTRIKLWAATKKASTLSAPHKGGPLSDGDVSAGTVTCPLRARRIGLKNGEVLYDDLSCTFSFPVKAEDGSIHLDTRALSSLGAAAPA